MKKMMKNNWRLTAGIFLVILAVFIACKRDPNKKPVETATSGDIKISIDESFKLLFDTEIYTFEALYGNANITPLYKPDVDVINDLLKDSVRNIVTTRKLTKEDEDFFKSKQQYPKTVVIAFDALAFIVNKSNIDTDIESTTIEEIFKGKIKTWNEINPKNNAGKLQIVFDNIKSGNVSYFKEKYKLDSTLPASFLAANSNEDVISYVEKHPNAMGILSVNWISDRNDTVSESFLSRINVVALSSEDAPGSGDYYQPYQAYIANGSYPFVREVYMICNESFTGLGSGFLQFVAGEKGQRIILKSKLVPSTMPVRIVEFK